MQEPERFRQYVDGSCMGSCRCSEPCPRHPGFGGHSRFEPGEALLSAALFFCFRRRVYNVFCFVFMAEDAVPTGQITAESLEVTQSESSFLGCPLFSVGERR